MGRVLLLQLTGKSFVLECFVRLTAVTTTQYKVGWLASLAVSLDASCRVLCGMFFFHTLRYL